VQSAICSLAPAACACTRLHCSRMKRLIINADDFGLTTGVNRAIAEAHQRGVLTSATLMAGGAAFEEAVSLARALPRLSVGCHIDLIQLAPVSPPAEVPSLVNGALFRPGFARFAGAALCRRLSAEEIAAEAEAQIRKLQSAGIMVTHFDSHKHTHIFSHVLGPLLQAAKRCGVGAVRNPFEPRPRLGCSEVMSTPKLLGRYCVMRAFQSMSSRFQEMVKAEGMATTDGTVGIVLTGSLTERRLLALIRRIPEGTWELLTHPGYNEATLSRLTALTLARQKELALLTSATIRAQLRECGVQLISYRDLLAPGV
jgi:hopanoid biosynthesis associated protein HpnK